MRGGAAAPRRAGRPADEVRGPRTGLAFARLLLAAFLAGVIGGFVWALAPGEVSWLGPLSGAALALGAVLFLGFLLRQLAGRLRTTWGRLIAAAGMWMVLWAGAALLLRSRASAEGPGAYGEAMRQLLMELAIFGFALNAIYGFGQRLLRTMPSCRCRTPLMSPRLTRQA